MFSPKAKRNANEVLKSAEDASLAVISAKGLCSLAGRSNAAHAAYFWCSRRELDGLAEQIPNIREISLVEDGEPAVLDRCQTNEP